MINNKSVTAIIVAAGTSSRMGFDKLAYKINGQTVLEKSIYAFATHEYIDDIIVVCNRERAKGIRRRYFCSKPHSFTAGASLRQHSVLIGVMRAEGEIIAIHDAARPFVSKETISMAIIAADATGAAAPAVGVKDTIKAVEEGIIKETIPRETLFAVQTPQVFNTRLYLEAVLVLPRRMLVTDDCQIMELAGYPVTLTKGEYENYKITTPDDIKEEKHMRIGHGYDVHCLCEGRKLILGGIEIEHERGLLGHSDADVLIHAIMDALLGAAALGDIGVYFPDTSAEFKGASSIVLLKHVARVVRQEGFTIENIDSTILCESPRLRPYIDAMRAAIARATSIKINAVSVKATTEEGLGFTGAKEGVAAHAVVLLG